MQNATAYSHCTDRLDFLDILRGLAVICMIVFHFFFDLGVFGFVRWSFVSGPWAAFSMGIASTFLFCVGLSLHYAYRDKFDQKKFLVRSLKLFFAALIVSISTYLLYPHAWIYFGTLHCIFVSSILGLWFVYHRRLAFIAFVAILTGQNLLGYDIEWVSKNITKKYSLDFIPIYPWFSAVLLGIILAPYLQRSVMLGKLRAPSQLSWLSQRSLSIYLIHQPVLFALVYLGKMIFY